MPRSLPRAPTRWNDSAAQLRCHRPRRGGGRPHGCNRGWPARAARAAAGEVRQAGGEDPHLRRRALQLHQPALLAGELSVAEPALLCLGAEALHRSEEHTSELQSLMRISYAVLCFKKKTPKESTKQSTDRLQRQYAERRTYSQIHK